MGWDMPWYSIAQWSRLEAGRSDDLAVGP
jgi:hypothetical protein